MSRELDDQRGEAVPQLSNPARRIFRSRGRFILFEKRPNIARAEFFYAGYSHPEDDLNSRFNIAWTRKNRQQGSSVEQMRKLRDFHPSHDILIKRITVSVMNMPKANHQYFVGDNCVYVTNIENNLTSEIHCTATSVWTDRYSRSLQFPNELGLLLTAREKIRCPVHMALIFPAALNTEEIKPSMVETAIEYEIAAPDRQTQKFLRIPYLDQTPDAPQLLIPDRPWYQAWDRKEPLVVRGLSVYFAPKPIRDQVVEDICIYAVDAAGRPIPGKRLCLPNQRYVTGTTHLTLEPAFLPGNLVIEPGEYLSASARLVQGNRMADCALFVLVDVPSSKRNENYHLSPLYHSQGAVNFEYAKGQYVIDRKNSRPTPAGKAVLQKVLRVDASPWREARKDMQPDWDEEAQLDFATKILFAD